MARTSGLALAASGVLLSACSVFGVRTVAEPAFRVVGHLGGVEIRSYGPRLAAQVVVGGSEIDARSAGFRALAGYIFGANHGKAKIEMTAPVTQSAGSAQVAMTAPVDQAPTPDGRWTVRFMMPAQYTAETLPAPNNLAVQIVSLPAQTVAVLRYSGIPTVSAGRDASARLLRALEGSPYHVTGPVMGWFYDPPWTIPPLRRNEAAVSVTG